MSLYTVYGHNECPWCDKTLTLLDKEGLPYSYINVRVNLEARNDLVRRGYRTVPQVFYGQKLIHTQVRIGGYEDLVAFIEKNKKSNK